MKTLYLSVAALALASFSGCMEGNPGGPGVTNPVPSSTSSTTTTTAQRPDYSQADQTFNLSTPALSTHVKQGETKAASVGVSRGKNFDQDVTLKFEDVPTGVTITPANPVIKHGDSEAKMNIQATADAALGNFTVKVTGHPATGADANNTFKLTVEEK
jgi:hypothetical protein